VSMLHLQLHSIVDDVVTVLSEEDVPSVPPSSKQVVSSDGVDDGCPGQRT
jgi:hypothetical protein